MFCAQCGTEADPASRRCVKCDSDLSGWFPSASPSTGEVTVAAPSDGVLTHRPASSGDTLVPGQKFGTRYTIIKKLGVGGPNVVRIHDLGELGETNYLTMAYVDGAETFTSAQ
jgi:hypothetical protein